MAFSFMAFVFTTVLLDRILLHFYLTIYKLKVISKAKMEFTRLLQIVFPEFIKKTEGQIPWVVKSFLSKKTLDSPWYLTPRTSVS
ncbi:MAG: hypothetical protein COA82_12410 [Alkaliphilus sp.]|nr:MAG: hypothetical protein COA82_12410 [Alkaliphilus sp.]